MYTMVIGPMMNPQDMDKNLLLMVMFIKDCFCVVSNTEKVDILGQMDLFIKVIGLMEKFKEQESILRQMVKDTRENGKTI